jgi:hypothetical protein
VCDAAVLAIEHPPRFTHPNKQAVFGKLMTGTPPAGRVAYSRWSAPALPARRTARAQEITRHGFFTYADESTDMVTHWHVNFANFDVFSYYAGPLLAQDELQVLEHPGLASVRHAIEARGESTLCMDQDEPFPILVSGVERRGAFDTGPGPGRPQGLYGNNFARADQAVVLSATERLIRNAPATSSPSRPRPTARAPTMRTRSGASSAPRRPASGRPSSSLRPFASVVRLAVL